jgi:hypothetical protein
MSFLQAWDAEAAMIGGSDGLIRRILAKACADFRRTSFVFF